MEYKKLSTPLPINQIEFRVQSINKGGYATILAYKDARADMNRLDDVLGVTGWKREHTRDNRNCIVSIWCDEKKQWISKEDTGTESNAEAAKGLASDSFKRACFNLGIGRELYDYPIISIKLKQNEFKLEKDKYGNDKAKATWDLKIKQWVWSSSFEDGILSELSCVDDNGVKRFDYSLNKQPTPTPKTQPVKIDLERLKNRLEACETMEALATAFKSLNKEEQKAGFATKEAMKVKLTIDNPKS